MIEELARDMGSKITFNNSVEAIMEYKGESVIGGDPKAKFNYKFSGEEYSHIVLYEGETNDEIISLGISELDYYLDELITVKVLSTKGASTRIKVYHELNELSAANDIEKYNDIAITFYRRCKQKGVVPADIGDIFRYRLGSELS